MNILVFSWRDPRHPLAGGAEQVIHEHMKGWLKAGHQVTLFSSYIKNMPVEEVIDNAHIVRQGNQYLGVQLKAFIYYQKNKKRFDLVVDQFHGLPFFTPLYIKIPKLAVIQETAREVWFLNPFPFPINYLIGICGYLFEPLIFLLYRNINFMTGSQSAKNDVIKFGIPAKNITVVPHGVILENPYQFPIKEKKFTIVYLGILSKDKGIEDALICFSLLKSDTRYQFWVIGKPESKEYSQKIDKLVFNLGLKTRVKFWGYVDQKKKFELLARAHILINPSVREGWGLVNIEANSMKTPVIAYQSSGLIDSVINGKSGILCTEKNPRSLANTVQKIINNKKQLEYLQNESKKWSKNFSWKKSTQMSYQLLTKIHSSSTFNK